MSPDAPESEKDKLIAEQTKTIRELEIVVRGYEENLGEPLRAVREDVEREYEVKLQDERAKREEKEAWTEELVRQLEVEKSVRAHVSKPLNVDSDKRSRSEKSSKRNVRHSRPLSPSSMRWASAGRRTASSPRDFVNQPCPRRCSARQRSPHDAAGRPTQG